MGALVLTFGFVAWAVAAVGFFMVAAVYVRLAALAPSGQKFAALLDLGFWNFPAVSRRIGPPAEPLLRNYRRGFAVFIAAFAVFFGAVIVNIVSGTAA